MLIEETDITGMPKVQPRKDTTDTGPLWLLVMLAVIVAFATVMVVYH